MDQSQHTTYTDLNFTWLRTFWSLRCKVALLVALSFLTSGCFSGSSLFSTKKTTTSMVNSQNDHHTQYDTSQFGHITDIPIPVEARLNVTRSIILGSENKWVGRAELETPFTINEMYDFYERQMVIFGWIKLTSMQADRSVMSFFHSNRLATIQISNLIPNSSQGSIISISVAPVDTENVIIKTNVFNAYDNSPTPKSPNAITQQPITIRQ